MLQARLLGGFRLEANGQIVNHLRSQKALSLLAYLLSYPGLHRRDSLAQLFWGDKPAESARNNLRVALSLIRRVLEPPGVPAGSVLQSTRRKVGVSPDLVETDVKAFEAVVQQAMRSADPVERRQLFQQACMLYRGDFLPDLDDGWVTVERERLRRFYEEARHEAEAPWSGRAVHGLSRVVEGLGVVIGILSETPDPRLRSWARAAAAAQQGTLLSAEDDAVFLFFNSLDRALRSLDALQEQLKMCRFAVEVGELRPSGAHGRGDLQDTVDSMLRVGAPQQILCTERVATLLSPRKSPPRCGVVRLGFYRLGQLDRSEPLYQLNFKGRNRSFPPVKASPALRSALPDAPTPFVGREEELAQLQRWIREDAVRLITVIGAPGIGKSRLAQECAHRMETLFGDARWWVQPAPGDSIGETLARRLGWEWRDEATLVATLSGVLGDMPALLVVDGLDYWDAVSKEELSRMLQTIPNLYCLVTAYAPLNLAGEQAYLLQPLPVPPDCPSEWEQLMGYASVRLFIERTQRVTPQFSLSAHNAQEVACLCRYLEGIPLAIELAAAHSGGKNLAQLLKQLQRSARWLRERPTGTLSRSLYASLTTVYQALSPELRLFWARLGVFHAGFTAEAAQAVASPPDASVALPALERMALIQAQDGRRRLLEPLRLFAEAQLKESNTLATARSAHWRYYLDLAIRLGNDPTRWFELEQERENLHAALEWASEHAPEQLLSFIEALRLFWERRGCEQATYQVLLQLPGRLPTTEAQVEAAGAALNLAVRRGDMERAQSLAEQYLSVADSLPDDSLAAARFWTAAGFSAWMQGEYESSVILLRRAIERAQALQATQEEASALVHLGVAYWTRGALPEAEDTLQRALQLTDALDAPIVRLKAMSNLASVLYQRGDHTDAEQYLQETLQLAQALGDRRTVATLLNNWAVWVRERGDHGRARELCLQAAAIWQELHEAIGETASIFNLADIAFHEGDCETASLLFHRSLESLIRYRLFWYLPHALQNLAELALRQDRTEEAREWLRACLYASLRYGATEQTMRSLRALADHALKQNDFYEAARWALLIEPLCRQPVPDNLVRTLTPHFSPAEWSRLLHATRTASPVQIQNQLEPYFEELLRWINR